MVTACWPEERTRTIQVCRTIQEEQTQTYHVCVPVQVEREVQVQVCHMVEQTVACATTTCCYGAQYASRACCGDDD